MKAMIDFLKNKLYRFKEEKVWNEISFAALCVAQFLVPFNSYLLKRVIYLAILALIVAKVLASKKEGFKLLTDSYMKWPTVIFLMAMFLSSIMAVDISESFSVFFERICVYIAIFWAVTETIFNKKRLFIFFGAISLTAFVVGFDAVYQFFSGYDLFFNYPKSYDFKALTGPFGEHNYFAGYLEMLVPFCMVIAFYVTKLWKKVYLMLTASMLFFALIFDYQRATLLIVCAVVVFFIVLIKKRFLGLIILVICLLPMILPAQMKHRFTKTFTKVTLTVNEENEPMWIIPVNPNVPEEMRFIKLRQNKPLFKILRPGWDNSRLNLWAAAYYLFKQKPFLGHGINSYEAFVNSNPDLYLPSIHAHSTYFQLLAETGAFGLISFLIIIFFFLARFWGRLRCLSENDRILLLAPSAAVLSSVVQAFTSNNMIYGLGFPYIFWTLIAVASRSFEDNVEEVAETTVNEKKINVLFMSAASEVGGAEKVVLDIVSLLDKEKYHCILLNQGEGAFTERFSELGGETICLKMPGWRKAKAFFSRYIALLKIFNLIQTKNVDLVHCNAYRLGPYLKWIERFNLSVGFVHIHDLVTKAKAKKFDLFKLDNLVAVSDAVADVFRQNTKAIDVIYNGVDLERFKANAKTDSGSLTVGMVANFQPIKRHNLFVDIAESLLNINPDVKFILVGDNLFSEQGGLARCKEYAASKGLAEKIVFTGRVEDPENYMKQMDVFLLTAKEEACPLVVLEAMASACLVIADENAGGTTSLIKDGVDGLLIDCMDVEYAANKINDILKDKMLREQIIAKARLKAENQFTYEIFAKNIDNYYSNLLKKNSENKCQ